MRSNDHLSTTQIEQLFKKHLQAKEQFESLNKEEPKEYSKSWLQSTIIFNSYHIEKAASVLKENHRLYFLEKFQKLYKAEPAEYSVSWLQDRIRHDKKFQLTVRQHCNKYFSQEFQALRKAEPEFYNAAWLKDRMYFERKMIKTLLAQYHKLYFSPNFQELNKFEPDVYNGEWLQELVQKKHNTDIESFISSEFMEHRIKLISKALIRECTNNTSGVRCIFAPPVCSIILNALGATQQDITKYEASLSATKVPGFFEKLSDESVIQKRAEAEVEIPPSNTI